MYRDAHNAYLESRILTADSVELVSMLYQACSRTILDARRYLATGDIAARSQSISKACEILLELASALDHERGGEISARLARLYDYMQRKLLEAHLRKSDELMAEVLGLLATLGDAWTGVSAEHALQPQEKSAWLPPVADAAAASATWSL